MQASRLVTEMQPIVKGMLSGLDTANWGKLKILAKDSKTLTEALAHLAQAQQLLNS